MTFLLSLFLLLLLSSDVAAAPGPASVPLHDIIGKNLTSSNVYFLRNYTVGSYSGKGLALYARCRCAKFVGFASSDSDTGLPVRLTPADSKETVIYPGERFKFTLASPPPCSRDPELGIQSGRRNTHVVTRGRRATESYFSVAVDDFGKYSLQYCGACAQCKNLCVGLGVGSRSGCFSSGGTPFNFFFQKKVSDGLELLQLEEFEGEEERYSMDA